MTLTELFDTAYSTGSEQEIIVFSDETGAGHYIGFHKGEDGIEDHDWNILFTLKSDYELSEFLAEKWLDKEVVWFAALDRDKIVAVIRE